MKRGHTIERYLLLAVLLALSLTGCDVHEFPDVPERIRFTLLLDSKTELPIHEEIYHTKEPSPAKGEHDRRYIINAYRSDDGKKFGRDADTTLLLTRRLSDAYAFGIDMELPAGFYKFIAWSDHVDKGTTSDKYWNTGNFAEITYASREDYEGCNDYKDAFQGTVSTLIHYDQESDGNIVSQVATLELERPLAKFRFIATDLKAFVERELARAEQKDEETSRSVNPEDYRVVFYYTGYMPCSFNMFTNKPNDSWTSVTFDGRMLPLENDEMELGFDYVLVNGKESKISVVAEVYDKEGELLSRTKTVEVPIVRSKLTIVRGQFLTSMATGNIGIDTDYDGDINIEIV